MATARSRCPPARPAGRPPVRRIEGRRRTDRPGAALGLRSPRDLRRLLADQRLRPAELDWLPARPRGRRAPGRSPDGSTWGSDHHETFLRLRALSPWRSGWPGFSWPFYSIGSEDGSGTTVTRLSPDETIRARLIERSPDQPGHRSQSVRSIWTSWTKARPSGFSSRPIRVRCHSGSERLDLVEGRDEAPPRRPPLLMSRTTCSCDNGDQLYFLYDVPSKQSWWNRPTPSPSSPSSKPR